MLRILLVTACLAAPLAAVADVVPPPTDSTTGISAPSPAVATAQTAPAPAPTKPDSSPYGADDAPVTEGAGYLLFKTLIVLAVVVALIYLTLNVGARKLLRLGAPSNALVKVIDRVPLEPKKSLLVLQVGGEFMLVGSSETGLNLITKLDAEGVQKALAERIAAQPTSTFLERLNALARPAPPEAPMRTRMLAALRRLFPVTLALGVLGSSGLAFAGRHVAAASQPLLSPELANATANGSSFAGKPLVLLVALAAMSLLPFVLLMVTSFVKISVVLSIVRSALGTQQIPPTQVITGLAIILTVYIMSPVALAMYRATGGPDGIASSNGELFSEKSVPLLLEAASRAKEPLRNWLEKHANGRDRQLFYSLAKRMREGPDKDTVTERDFMIIVPAFVISELAQAFQIGFILFVPFIVIDMVVANILLALGMHMLSPTTISMPFKLLLFVLVGGWYLLAKGLVETYL